MTCKRTVIDSNGVRYELAEKLGEGGQGVVYAVKGARLAVKLLTDRRPTRCEQMRNQLSHVRRLPLRDLALAKPLEMLRPPDAGYVMELVTGMVPIKTLLSPAKGEAPSTAWYLGTGGLRRRLLVLGRTASVLARLHGKGLAYADPSPANIFVSAASDFNEVRFIDTDNLRYESAPRSKGGVFTRFYGAPELVRGESGVNTLTDLHAFAVIAFQVLTAIHPFIGDYVDDGEPEIEERALMGLVPWIEDADDDINRASFGVPRSWVLSKLLKECFDRAFGAGRTDPAARPRAAEWAERLFDAAHATIACSDCGGTYYFNQPQCSWCDTDPPNFVVALFHLWDPELGPDGGLISKPDGDKLRHELCGHGAVTDGQAFKITRRLAFGPEVQVPDEPVIEATLDGNELRLKSVDGKAYRLLSATGNRATEVGNRDQAMKLAAGQSSWRLHFGDKDQLHRVVSFDLRLGSTS